MRNSLYTLILVLFFSVTHAYATDEWRYEFTPYLLAAGMDGTVGIRNFTTDIDASFSDILDNLDMGFMGLFTARKGPWLLGFEGVYMKLKADGGRSVTGPGGIVSLNGEMDITSELSIIQGTVGYQIVDDETSLDVLGGIRYTKLEADFDVKAQFTPGVIFPGGSISADGSEDWADAIVGLHATHKLSDSVELMGYADVGAGGSDITYQFMGGVNWEFTEGFRARFGYRYLYWDYEDGGTEWDISASGPYLGVGIQF